MQWFSRLTTRHRSEFTSLGARTWIEWACKLTKVSKCPKLKITNSDTFDWENNFQFSQLNQTHSVRRRSGWTEQMSLTIFVIRSHSWNGSPTTPYCLHFVQMNCYVCPTWLAVEVCRRWHCYRSRTSRKVREITRFTGWVGGSARKICRKLFSIRCHCGIVLNVCFDSFWLYELVNYVCESLSSFDTLCCRASVRIVWWSSATLVH